MNIITKEDKGITIIALIITIILMLILVSVTTYTGLDTYKNAQVTKFVAQMQLLQTKVDDLVETKTIEELDELGLQSPTTDEEQRVINYAFINGELTTDDMTLYKVFTQNDILEILDEEDVQDTIMVNFKTREIVSLTGIEYEGSMYYTQYKLPKGQKIVNNNNSTTRDLSFTLDLSIDGINSIVTAKDIKITNGTLSFAETDLEGNKSNWQTVTNYTEKDEYTANISKSGKYIFRLQDNASKDNYTEESTVITLTNRPKTSSSLEGYNYGEDSNVWAYVQKDSINYVWIPRFVYKVNSDDTIDIKFIKGNSNIATDNTYINSEWTLHDKFTAEDGTGLTGIWVSVDSKVGLNMIDLLNDTTKTTLVEI